MNPGALSRRLLLQSAGALLVSFSLPPATAQNGRAAVPPPDLDSFLAIGADGKVTIFTSHVDVGTGILTAYRQIAAEELDIPIDRFTVVEGDTARTPDHGGTGGSSGVPRGGVDIRRAAATARQALLQLGAAEWKRPAAELTIRSGEVVPTAGGPGLPVARLIGGKRFDLKVDPNAPLKSPATYTVVGKPIPRADLPSRPRAAMSTCRTSRSPACSTGASCGPPPLAPNCWLSTRFPFASFPASGSCAFRTSSGSWPRMNGPPSARLAT